MKKQSLILFILLIISILYSSSVSAVLSDCDGISYYQFDDDSNDTGSLGNNFDLNTSFNNFVPGIVENAINFTGSQSHFANNVTLVGTQINAIRTIDLWFRPKAIGTSQQILTIMQDDGNNFNIAMTAGNIISARAEGSIAFTLTSDLIITAEEWIQIIITMGTGGAKMYINGTINGTSASTDVFPTAYDIIRLATHHSIPPTSFGDLKFGRCL